VKASDLSGIKHLIGAHVRVTVVFEIHGFRYDPEVFDGRLLAIGRKQGPSQNTRPICLVLDASDHNRGVPIIAIRSITSVEPLAAQPAGGGS
jgi:hypothetical protein